VRGKRFSDLSRGGEAYRMPGKVLTPSGTSASKGGKGGHCATREEKDYRRVGAPGCKEEKKKNLQKADL